MYADCLFTDTTISTGINNGQYNIIGIDSITCPNDFSTLSQCSFGLADSSDTNCLYHYNDLRIVCTNSELLRHFAKYFDVVCCFHFS